MTFSLNGLEARSQEEVLVRPKGREGSSKLEQQERISASKSNLGRAWLGYISCSSQAPLAPNSASLVPNKPVHAVPSWTSSNI